MQKNLPQKVHDSIGEHLRQKYWRRVVTALACVVVFCTTYALILPAVTMTDKTYCGKETHTHTQKECYERVLICNLEEKEATEPVSGHIHTDECYETKSVLVCGLDESSGHSHGEGCYDEDGNLTCEQEEMQGHTHDGNCYQEELSLTCGLEETKPTSDGHTHTDTCYEEKLVCQQEEHEHTLICYSNPEADVESAAVWERTLPQNLSDNWSENVVAVAKSQLGYAESTENYTVLDDGVTMKGYTRYGEWYGDPYGDWCAMFASFCLHYAGVPQAAVPYDSNCTHWVDQLQDAGLYERAADCFPEPGFLVFFDTDSDSLADHVGIVTEVTEDGETIKTVEGNISDVVVQRSYSESNAEILGYGLLPSTSEESVASEMEEENALISVAAVNTASLSAAPDYIGAINTANEWQIVAEQYSGNANSNKVGYDTDGDGVNDVLLQKNVVPTETENEFLVYLSVTKQMTWDELLAQSRLGLTTQGRWTDADVGRLVNTSDIGGNRTNILQPGMGQRNYQATIYLTRGGTTVHTFTGWYNGTTPNASNCTGYIILNGLDNKAIIASAKVNLHQDGSGTGGTLEYTIDLDKMAQNGIYYELDEIELNTVEDTLGDGIIYDGCVNCDGTVSESNGTLTWNITENPDIEGVNYTNPTTGYIENVAQLVYRVKLDVTQEGFHSCADNMDSTSNEPESYAVNEYATLHYQMGDNTYMQNFPVPYVRGLLYNITFDKESTAGKSLTGAVFALYESDGTTPVKKSDGTDYTITTVAGQINRFVDLPTGTYVMKEISPPKHYSAGDTSVWTINLCYTTDSNELSQDTTQRTNLRYTGNDTNGKWVIQNPRNEYIYQLRVIKTDDTGKKLLQNVPFAVTNPGGEELLTGTTDEKGSIVFNAEFRPGIEYVLTETDAPDGYQPLPANIKFKIIDDIETDTQTVELVNEAELNGLVSLELSEEDDKPVLEIRIINQPGYILPETGGPGTTLFTLCGLCLMILASALMYRYFIRWKRERRFW